MHKIHDKPFTKEDFSCEKLLDEELKVDNGFGYNPVDFFGFLLKTLNLSRELFLETKDKKYWWQMIQLLPSSYNQKRTLCLNYQVLKSMYHARKNHKLDEWHVFCRWVETLPYAKELIILD